MSLFLELIQGDEELRSIFASARAEYFPGTGAFSGNPQDAPAAEMRLLEWFLFEHDLKGKLTIEGLMPEWRQLASPQLAAQESVFLGTMASMFVLVGPAGDGLHWLRDLAGLGEFATDLRTPADAVQVGDLVVGRLYSGGDSTHILSPGAGCFRDEELLKAVQGDVDLARNNGQRKALRMRQVDLEAMFWGSGKKDQTTTPTHRLRSFLDEGGLSADEIDGLVESLAQQPLPEDTSSPLIAGYISELLNHLAFETDIDLTKAQELFLSCWVHLQSATNGAVEERDDAGDLTSDAQIPEQQDTKSAVDAFSEDRTAGLDATESISRLCERLGIDVEDDSDETETDGHSGAPVLPLLLTEYLWDIGRTDGEEATLRHACLEEPLTTLDDIQIVEELTAKRLLLLGCTVLVQDPDVSVEQSEVVATALERFCRWCVEHHGVPKDEDVERAFESFPASLIRVIGVNKALNTQEASGDWFIVEASEGGLVVRPDSPDIPIISLSALAEHGLEEGDFVRGAIQQDELVVTRCYPRELSAAK
ncbi:MAG: hypothetical protein OSB14_03425 [Planctomycetota bacterium]|nr:hypothetical protein [Planctomycetota bacterium]